MEKDHGGRDYERGLEKGGECERKGGRWRVGHLGNGYPVRGVHEGLLSLLVTVED